MDGSTCGHEVALADCSQCIILAAGVPQSTYPPLIRAARHPDVSRLRSLLNDLPAARLDPGGVTWPSSEISHGKHGVWKSPLTEAILADLPANAALLLEYKADPNGFPCHLFGQFSSYFVRHRPLYLRAETVGSLPPREAILKKILSPQMGPLTDDEIESRRLSQCRFWAEKDFPVLESASKGPITALEAAAKMGDKETFARLIQAGADTTAWTTKHQDRMPDIPPPSYLTLTTPLYHAIKSDNPAMVAYLLSSHHSPDYFPLSTITRSLNATMYLLTLPSPSPTLLDILLPATSLSVRTPMYNCHILHIAAATLSLPLFQQIADAVGPTATHLSELPPTALGHTPLHIACLPLDDTHINLHSPKIHASIHEVRSLSDTWQPLNLLPHPPRTGAPPTAPAHSTSPNRQRTPSPSPREPNHPTPSANAETPTPHLPSPAADIPSELTAQSALVKHLLRTRYADPLTALADQDVHGNTALHYLASARYFNEGLWMWICGMIKRWRVAEAARGGRREEEQRGPGEEVGRGGAADGYDSLIAIRNRWGFCPADLFLENREVRGEVGSRI